MQKAPPPHTGAGDPDSCQTVMSANSAVGLKIGPEFKYFVDTGDEKEAV